MIPFRSLRILILTPASLLAIPLAATEPTCDLNVNVSLTDEGRKLTPPTRTAPAYYYPVVAGYSELGEIVVGEKIPSRKETIRLLAKALAQQGYLVSQSEELTPPTLMLVFRWGYLNPVIQVTEEDNESPDDPDGTYRSLQRTVFFNKAQMLALVSGRAPDEVDNFMYKSVEEQRTLQEAVDPRYFVLVSAYELASFRDHRKKKLYWQARVSVPSAQVSSLGQVLPSLIASVAPFFGRETIPPHRINAPAVREGVVDVGTPTVSSDSPKK